MVAAATPLKDRYAPPVPVATPLSERYESPAPLPLTPPQPASPWGAAGAQWQEPPDEYPALPGGKTSAEGAELGEGAGVWGAVAPQDTLAEDQEEADLQAALQARCPIKALFPYTSQALPPFGLFATVVCCVCYNLFSPLLQLTVWVVGPTVALQMQLHVRWVLRSTSHEQQRQHLCRWRETCCC